MVRMYWPQASTWRVQEPVAICRPNAGPHIERASLVERFEQSPDELPPEPPTPVVPATPPEPPTPVVPATPVAAPAPPVLPPPLFGASEDEHAASTASRNQPDRDTVVRLDPPEGLVLAAMVDRGATSVPPQSRPASAAHTIGHASHSKTA